MSTEAEAIAALAAKGAVLKEPVVIALPGGRATLYNPMTGALMDVTDQDSVDEPARVRQSITVQTVDSLIDYVDDFKTSASRMFADIAANRIVAVLDYHAESDVEEDEPPGADLLTHRATLQLPYAEEWKVWTAASGKMLPQLDFARFLEENAADIAAPSGADLLEIVHDLHAVRKVNFKKAVRTATDHENFEYSEETNATARNGAVEIPTKFLLRIPVYFGEEPVEVYAFLRWKLDEGALNLGIVLHRVEHVRQGEFKRIVSTIAAQTERPAIFGTLGQ